MSVAGEVEGGQRAVGQGWRIVGVVASWVWLIFVIFIVIGFLSEAAIVAALLALLAGIVALPVSTIAKRWKATPLRNVPRVVPSAMLIVVAFVVMFANETPEKRAQREAAAAARVKADVAEEKRDQAATAAEEKRSRDAAAAEVQVAMKGFYDRVIGDMTPCDEAANKIAKAAQQMGAGSATLYDGYAVAKEAESVCQDSYIALSDADVPSELPDAARDKATEAINLCQSAVVGKKAMGTSAQVIFDGDARPSALSQFQDAAKMGQRGVLACIAGLFEVANAANVDVATLGKS
jgi:flagellar biosynthesis GTPase FlhF